MAAIAIAKEMDTDKFGFEYDIDFDDVVGVMMINLGDAQKKATVYLGKSYKKGTSFNLTKCHIDAEEVDRVADRIGYLDFF